MDDWMRYKNTRQKTNVPLTSHGGGWSCCTRRFAKDSVIQLESIILSPAVGLKSVKLGIKEMMSMKNPEFSLSPTSSRDDCFWIAHMLGHG